MFLNGDTDYIVQFFKVTFISASLALNLRIREEDILKCSGVNMIEFLSIYEISDLQYQKN